MRANDATHWFAGPTCSCRVPAGYAHDPECDLERWHQDGLRISNPKGLPPITWADLDHDPFDEVLA